MTTDQADNQSNPDSSKAETIATSDERTQARPPPEAATTASGVPAETGEGGPQSIVTTAGAPASSGRPQRAPHLDTTTREIIVDPPAPERAIVTRARRRRAQRREMTRRQLMKVSFWGVFGFGLTGGAASFLSFCWPRGVQGFGGKIVVSATLVPEAGAAPVAVTFGKFWLVHLNAGEGTHGGFGEEGDQGLVALWWKCPHLGCTIPWKSTFRFRGLQGWFRCPCHGSTYTKAGVRVFGPAPRPMDTMAVVVNVDGSVTVDSGSITKGNQENPQRSVRYNI